MSYANELIEKYTRQAKENCLERQYCLVCTKRLEHKPTGRPREFCSNACKQKDYREIRKWASVCIENYRMGLPDPPRSWRKGEMLGVPAPRPQTKPQPVLLNSSGQKKIEPAGAGS